jgi:hypothetical protein
MTVFTADIACALDPVILAKRAGIEADPWQQTVLRSRAQRVLMNCCRQSGKSTMAAVLAMHTAIYQPGSLILLLSPSLRQSQELFRKCLDIYRVLNRPVAAQAESALRLELEHGSRIVSLPGKEGTVRGYSGVRLLVVDEAARVADELYYSVRPMLAVSGGTLVALSTPWGRRGWWHEEWMGADPIWQRIRVPAEQCPRIPAEFLAEERRSLGKLFYASEYQCEFVDTIDQMYSYDEVSAAITDDVKPLFGG